MLPVNSGGHTAYQNFVTENLRKYYPDPNALARSTWDIIERFWNLDLSYTDELLADKYSKSYSSSKNTFLHAAFLSVIH